MLGRKTKARFKSGRVQDKIGRTIRFYSSEFHEKAANDTQYNPKSTIKTTAEEVVEYESRRWRNCCVDDEYQEALNNENEAYRQYKERNTRAKRGNYKSFKYY